MTNVLRLNAFIVFVYQEANYLCCVKCFIFFIVGLLHYVIDSLSHTTPVDDTMVLKLVPCMMLVLMRMYTVFLCCV